MPESQPDARSPGVEPAVLKSLPELVQFAGSVADEARPVSLRYFRAAPELLIKADGSPVTVADRETERVIRDLLSRSYPQHAVMGEDLAEAHSGIVDIAPTILHGLGIAAPRTMDGRVLREAFADGSSDTPDPVPERYETGVGHYRQVLQRTRIGESLYLDGGWRAA